jgi:hypothetical protein
LVRRRRENNTSDQLSTLKTQVEFFERKKADMYASLEREKREEMEAEYKYEEIKETKADP